jgi:hypothetical protein
MSVLTAEKHEIAQTLTTAFLTARLLTGSMTAAEDSVTGALDRWDPVGSPESFLEAVAEAASKYDGRGSDSHGLPRELQGVVGLSINNRRCFVLRILLGLPKCRCEQMLGLSAREIDESTCAALKTLGGSFPGSTRCLAMNN